MMHLISEIAKLSRYGAHAEMIELAGKACAAHGTLWLLVNRLEFRKRWAFRGVENIGASLASTEFVGVEDDEDTWA